MAARQVPYTQACSLPQGFWDVAPPDRNLTRQELYLLQASRV